jgi:Flp pilus assembly protein TadB
MAQTKRKRRSKHRGNAAGTIEARGRTGRPPSPEERKRQARAIAREERLNKPPTWSASVKRASLAAAFMFIFLFATNSKGNRVASALVFAVLAFAIYIPAGYWMEMFIYRRRQAKRAAGK